MSKPTPITINPSFDPHETVEHEVYGPCEKLVVVLTDRVGLFSDQQMSDLQSMIRGHQLRGEQAFLGVETHVEGSEVAVYVRKWGSPLGIRRMILPIIEEWIGNSFQSKKKSD